MQCTLVGQFNVCLKQIGCDRATASAFDEINEKEWKNCEEKVCDKCNGEVNCATTIPSNSCFRGNVCALSE